MAARPTRMTLLLALLLAGLAFAEDEVVLTRGRSIRGTVLEETEEAIKFQLTHGAIWIQRAAIRSLNREVPEEELTTEELVPASRIVLKNGVVLRAPILEENEESILIRLEYGKIRIERSLIEEPVSTTGGDASLTETPPPDEHEPEEVPPPREYREVWKEWANWPKVRYLGREYDPKAILPLLEEGFPSEPIEQRKLILRSMWPDPARSFRRELKLLLERLYDAYLEYYRLNESEMLLVDPTGAARDWVSYCFQPRFRIELLNSAKQFEQRREERSSVSWLLTCHSSSISSLNSPPPMYVYLRDYQEACSALPAIAWGMGSILRQKASACRLPRWLTSGLDLWQATRLRARKSAEGAELLDDLLLHYWFSKVGSRQGPSLVDVLHDKPGTEVMPFESWPVFLFLAERKGRAKARELFHKVLVYSHYRRFFHTSREAGEACRGLAMRLFRECCGEVEEAEKEVLQYLFEKAGPEILRTTAESLPWQGPPAAGVQEALSRMVAASSFDADVFSRDLLPLYLGPHVVLPAALAPEARGGTSRRARMETSARALWQVFGVLAYWRWIDLMLLNGKVEQAGDRLQQLQERLHQEEFHELADKVGELFEERKRRAAASPSALTRYLETAGRTHVPSPLSSLIPERYCSLQLSGLKGEVRVFRQLEEAQHGSWTFTMSVQNKTRKAVTGVTVWVQLFNSSNAQVDDSRSRFEVIGPGSDEKIELSGEFSVKEERPGWARVIILHDTDWGEDYMISMTKLPFN